MRLMYPTSGSARILGNPIDDVKTRARIGFLPENPYFYDYLSGRELLHYTAALFGISKAAARSRAVELLELVGLEPQRADRQLRKYSKGMLQRIGIAQALVNDPEVVFMDEPMSGLDPIGRREVRDLLLSLRKENKTVFFSSHILSDVEVLCDRAAILTKGKLLRSGTISELTAEDGSAVEVVASGTTIDAGDSFWKRSSSVQSVTPAPNGIQLVVKDETSVDDVITLIRTAGGKLVSVAPRRTTLEDLFAKGQNSNQANSDDG